MEPYKFWIRIQFIWGPYYVAYIGYGSPSNIDPTGSKFYGGPYSILEYGPRVTELSLMATPRVTEY